MENGLLHNFDMVHNIVVPIPVMVPAPAGTSDSRSNVPVPVSGVEEGKKTDTDTDSGAGITSPLVRSIFLCDSACFRDPILRFHSPSVCRAGASVDFSAFRLAFN